MHNQITDQVLNLANSLRIIHKSKKFTSNFLDWKNRVTRKKQSNSSLKVLYLLSQQPRGTGSGISSIELLKSLKSLGHETTLLAADYQTIQGKEVGLKDTEVRTVLFKSKTIISKIPVDLNFPIPGMSEQMPYEHIQFKNLNTDQRDDYFQVFHNYISSLINEIKPDIVHVSHLWFLVPIAKLAAPWLPIVGTSRGTDYLLLLDKPEFGEYIIEGVKSLDAVTTVSPTIAENISYSFQLPIHQISVIPNGFDQKKFFVYEENQRHELRSKILAKFNINSNSNIIIAVAKFSPWKGIKLLIRSTANYNPPLRKKTVTLIIGSGNPMYERELLAEINRLGLENEIKLIGTFVHSEIAKFMNASDLLVVPSVFEPFGRVIIEALATGLRVVATDRGGPPFIIDKRLIDNYFAALVRPIKTDSKLIPLTSDYQDFSIDLSNTIQSLLSKKIHTVDRFQIAKFALPFSWFSIAKNFIEIYWKAINKNLNRIEL